MKEINSERVFRRNEVQVDGSGAYVLYWLQINRRLQHNYSLEYAIEWANKLDKPLLI